MTTRHSETRRVPYSPAQMYDLVADVARYPEFLPWTAGARIRSRRPLPGEEIGEVMEADLVISFKVFRESYTSRVELRPPGAHDPARIDVQNMDGPFQKLITHYTFAAAPGGGCDMGFAVEFAFRNRILQSVAGAFFEEAMKRVVRAFEQRATQLYGAKV